MVRAQHTLLHEGVSGTEVVGKVPSIGMRSVPKHLTAERLFTQIGLRQISHAFL